MLEDRTGTIDLDDVWEAAHVDREDRNNQALRIRIGVIMEKLGWEYRRPRVDGKRRGIYQKANAEGDASERLAFRGGELCNKDEPIVLFKGAAHRRGLKPVAGLPTRGGAA